MWHRPYLLLYEQMVWKHAQDIAAQYPPADQTRYQAAAKLLRIPYWDWSLHPGMPTVLTQDQVQVYTPQGNQTISNPLKEYNFDPFDKTQFGDDVPPFNHSVRTPDSAGNSRTDSVNEKLNQYWQVLHNQAYTMLTSASDYQNFSNSAAPGGDNSIEVLHGYVHNFVGGYPPDNIGHMTLFPYSAFDPIFMLHHAMVDRLIAIWQALHPDTFAVPQKSGSDTYVRGSGAMEDADTPLLPFHLDDHGTSHTSNSVRYLKNLGYAYVDVLDWLHPDDPAGLAAKVRSNVNMMYQPENFGLEFTDSTNTTMRHIRPRGASPPSMKPGAALAAPTEWSLRVTLQGSLAEPTTLNLFTRDNTPLASLLIDTSSSSPFAPLQRQIPLTAALMAKRSHLDGNAVHAFLGGVRWEAAGVQGAGAGVGSNKVATLAATVHLELRGREVTPATKVDEFPTYGAWGSYGSVRLGTGGLLVPA